MAQLASIPIGKLQYDAKSRWLTGTLGRTHFKLLAFSGGGRGSIHPKRWQASLSSYSATTKDQKDHKGNVVRRGGTLPPGLYACGYVAAHPTYHECVRLFRDPEKGRFISSPLASHPIPHNRDDDFFIHGRGDLGSIGCIVPDVPAQRLLLTHAIRNYPGLVTLEVRHVSYALPAERFDGLSA